MATKRSHPAKRTRVHLSESSNSSSDNCLQINECSSLSSEASDCVFFQPPKKQRTASEFDHACPGEDFKYSKSAPLTSSAPPLHHINVWQFDLNAPVVDENLHCSYHPYHPPNPWLCSRIDYVCDVTNSSPEYCNMGTGNPNSSQDTMSDVSFFRELLDH